MISKTQGMIAATVMDLTICWLVFSDCCASEPLGNADDSAFSKDLDLEHHFHRASIILCWP